MNGLSMKKVFRPYAWVEVNLQAFRENILAVRNLVGQDVEIIGVMKGNAFNMGTVTMANTALHCGVNRIAVANLEGALELRNSGVKEPVIIFYPVFSEDVEIAVQKGLEVLVEDVPAAHRFSDAACKAGTTVKAHIKIDTGLGRFGALPDPALELVRIVQTLPGLHLEGIFTHFSTVDEDDFSFATTQMERFFSFLHSLVQGGTSPRIVHISNSGGLLRLKETWDSRAFRERFPGIRLGVRPGIFLFGHSPCPGPMEAKSVMSLKTRVRQVRSLPPDFPIGYGHTFRTSKWTKVALMPLGYGDGLPPLLANKGSVLIRGRKFPIVGRLSMNTMVANLGDKGDDIVTGDEVVVFGSQGGAKIRVEELAEITGGIVQEIITAVSLRLPRVYIE